MILRKRVLLQTKSIVLFVYFWSFTAPGQDSLSLYGKEQCQHSAKHLLLCFMKNQSHVGLKLV